METPLWIPPTDRTHHIDRFREMANERHGLSLTSSRDLHAWSIADVGDFWSDMWDFAGVIGDRGATAFEPGATLRDAQFFPDAQLNFAENLLRHAGEQPDAPAMIFRNELGSEADRTLSGSELRELVSQIAQAMRAHGIEPGDRVAAWLPNLPETYAVMLAAASIGAVFSSTSPDFGSAGVIDRFGQIEPRLLFIVDGYRYGGKTHDCLSKATDVVAQLPSVERVIQISYQDSGGPILNQAMRWADWLAPHQAAPLEFTRLPFNHPLYILYSSGTTGAPKCIVHRAGGILLKHLSEHLLHCDVQRGDRVFYFTTAGWMMWNWLASGLAVGATLVLYDGSPFHDDGAVLFELATDTRLTLFGTSAKFIDAVAKAGLRPVDTHDLTSIRTICSTGSPLMPEGFEFTYDAISATAHLASISGGTDLCGCLLAGDPTQPLFAGDIQTATFGLDTTVVDDDGHEVGPGERGELVCRTAFPSMPLGFWNDPGDTRYQAAYFDRFAGIWHQGDFAERTTTGGFAIHGRSDATLNPGGVRIGTAEIYRQVEQIDEVIEALVIGQEHDGDTRVVLFVVLRDDSLLTDDLQATIREQIRLGATPRHVPALIVEVPDLPRTRSGKIVELAVRDIAHGRPIKNREALANPEALAHFKL